jgi:hypothetical protein
VLGLALFVSQAFLHNAVLFSLGHLLKAFFGVASRAVRYYIAVFAIGNLLGPLTLSRLFDTIGREPMIAAPTCSPARCSWSRIPVQKRTVHTWQLHGGARHCLLLRLRRLELATPPGRTTASYSPFCTSSSVLFQLGCDEFS